MNVDWLCLKISKWRYNGKFGSNWGMLMSPPPTATIRPLQKILQSTLLYLWNNEMIKSSKKLHLFLLIKYSRSYFENFNIYVMQFCLKVRHIMLLSSSDSTAYWTTGLYWIASEGVKWLLSCKITNRVLT